MYLMYLYIHGGPQKCPYFSLAITFTKIRKPLRFVLSNSTDFEIWLIYESCNLIGQENFQPCRTKNLKTIFYTS